MIRLPAVAGRFYPAEPGVLADQVDSFLRAPPAAKVRAWGCIVPHAGYMYSGAVAGAVYARLELPRRLILLGPRHYPQGAALAILSAGAWQTPLGGVLVDAALAESLKQAFPALREDGVAHQIEHALEVQLPFLQRLLGDFRFVPIALGPVSYERLEALGKAMARIVSAERDEVLIVASSDMNHYEGDAITRVKDRKAIDRILELDPKGLYDTVRSEDISMCGYAAAVAMLTAAREMGATKAELVRYATSGDISGDREQVVGYAGIVVT